MTLRNESASRQAKCPTLPRHGTSHSLRHLFATHLLEADLLSFAHNDLFGHRTCDRFRSFTCGVASFAEEWFSRKEGAFAYIAQRSVRARGAVRVQLETCVGAEFSLGEARRESGEAASADNPLRKPQLIQNNQSTKRIIPVLEFKAIVARAGNGEPIQIHCAAAHVRLRCDGEPEVVKHLGLSRQAG